EGLAHVEGRLAESDYPGAFRYLAAHNRKRALTVLFTDVIDRTASDALVAHATTLRPRHVPLAAPLRAPPAQAVAARRPLATSRTRGAGDTATGGGRRGLRAGRRRGAARRPRGRARGH